MNVNEVIAWCCNMADAGHTLEICWEGGGDSGWVYFELDGKTIENDITEFMVNKMYDELDYGSWAGEFNASGRAQFDPATKKFVGTDHYSQEDDYMLVLKHPLQVVFPDIEGYVPASMEIDCGVEDGPNIIFYYKDARNVLYMGSEFGTEEQKKKVREMEEQVGKDILNAFEASGVSEWSCYDAFYLPDDAKVLDVTQIRYYMWSDSPREVCIDLEELLPHSR